MASNGQINGEVFEATVSLTNVSNLQKLVAVSCYTGMFGYPETATINLVSLLVNNTVQFVNYYYSGVVIGLMSSTTTCTITNSLIVSTIPQVSGATGVGILDGAVMGSNNFYYITNVTACINMAFSAVFGAIAGAVQGGS